MGIRMNQPFYLHRLLVSRQALILATFLLSCAGLYAVSNLRTTDGQLLKPQWLGLGSCPTRLEDDRTPKIQPVEIDYTPTSMEELTTAVGLAGVKVVALVFYGRQELVSILDCYLKRNLKANGGALDEVIFTVNTDNEGDLAYLEDLIKTSPYYRKFVKSEKHEGWMGQWEAVNETDAIYVKIDDDVVFIEDDTIAAVVERLSDNPQYFAVSANVVNNPCLSWVHQSMGVYRPYWPEMKPPREDEPERPSWRASELPDYKGPPTGPKSFDLDGSTPAPFPGHRWLPVRNPADEYQDSTMYPASTLTYDPFGPSLQNWAATAQTHYSFLEHLEAGDIWRYKFDVWDYHYQRISINFYAVRGRDIMQVFPFPGASSDDEGYLTQVRPREVRRHAVVDGRGLAVHFAFMPQRRAHDGHAMTDTDALERYRAFADEMVCPFPRRGSHDGV